MPHVFIRLETKICSNSIDPALSPRIGSGNSGTIFSDLKLAWLSKGGMTLCGGAADANNLIGCQLWEIGSTSQGPALPFRVPTPGDAGFQAVLPDGRSWIGRGKRSHFAIWISNANSYVPKWKIPCTMYRLIN